MLLTEYDEKKHLADTFAEGYEEGEQEGYSKGEQDGYSKGEQDGYSKGELFTQIRIMRKLIHKYPISEISDMMELDLEYVEQIVKILQQFPKKSISDIISIIKKEKSELRE